jgi:hypothetical protein
MLNKLKLFFFKIFYKINHFINNLLKKNLNKLNFNNLSNLIKSNNFLITFVTFAIFFLSYLLIPVTFDNSKIQKQLKDQLSEKLSLDFNFSQNLKYSFFPRPYFTSKNSTISNNQNEISEIKKLKIYVSLNSLFSLDKIKIKDIILENANFNLTYNNSNFFIKLLDKSYKDYDFVIRDSSIFYRNKENEVLFINKINNIKYSYDIKSLKNIATSENEIFNLPYTLELYNKKNEKKLFFKLNLDLLKLKIENEFDYSSDIKKGFASLIQNQKKNNLDYRIKKNSFNFNLFNKLNLDDYSYKGKANFSPFYSSLEGKTKIIDLSSLFNSNTALAQLLKTEILNNKNLDFYSNIAGSRIQNYENFQNIFLNFKIQEGLIDFDNTKFSWKNFVSFFISDSLLFVEKNELILDGTLNIIIKDYNKIYKSLLTPKDYRKKIEKIELNFKYNFDQKVLNFNFIEIDNIINKKLNSSFKSLIFKEDKLQNKIYLKNQLNSAIKSYAG